MPVGCLRVLRLSGWPCDLLATTASLKPRAAMSTFVLRLSGCPVEPVRFAGCRGWLCVGVDRGIWVPRLGGKSKR